METERRNGEENERGGLPKLYIVEANTRDPGQGSVGVGKEDNGSRQGM